MKQVTLREYLANPEAYQGYKLFSNGGHGRNEVTAVYPSYEFFCGKMNGGYGMTFTGHPGTTLELEAKVGN